MLQETDDFVVLFQSYCSINLQTVISL